MALVSNIVCTYPDAIDGIKPSRLGRMTAAAIDILLIYVSSKIIELLSHEAYDWAYVTVARLSQSPASIPTIRGASYYRIRDSLCTFRIV